MSAAWGRRRRDSDDPPMRQTRESADSTVNGSLAQFDPLAGYTEHQDTSRTAPRSPQAERPHRPDATTSTSFGVKSDRADSQIGRHSEGASGAMQRSNSSEAMPVQGVRVARRESWHAGQTTSSPEELRSLTSGSTARLRRRSTSAQTKHKATALQPPKLPELRESDDEFRVSAARCPFAIVDSGWMAASLEPCVRLLTKRASVCAAPCRDGKDVLPSPPPARTRCDPFTRRYFARTRRELERCDRARPGRLLSL